MAQELNIDDIVSVEEISTEYVYDLTIKDNHNYHLDLGDYALVHNSGKTYDAFYLIYFICMKNAGKGLDIYILRRVLKKNKDYTLKDFKKALRFIGAYDEKMLKGENTSPEYSLFGNTIYFRGLDDEEDSEGYPSDIVFINEALEVPERSLVAGILMRCRLLVIQDWNPKFTQHWAFDQEGQDNTFFTHSTYLDNKHLQDSVSAEIESYNPWLPNSYTVKNGTVMYEGKPVDSKNQPPPHPTNIDKRTADENRWKVYGLGIRGSAKGKIFQYYDVVDEFPDIGYSYGLDFGFTCFQGDTLIRTRTGEVKIKDMKIGDEVLTRKGYRKVLKVFDNGVKTVVSKKLGFDFGYKKISATFDHNFNANNRWKKFGELEKGDNLYLQSSLTDVNTIDTQKENTRTTTFTKEKKKEFISVEGFIEIFMNFIKGKYLKATRYITSISMRLITTSTIFNACLVRNTQRYMLQQSLLSTSLQKEFMTEKRTDIINQIGRKEEKLSKTTWLKKLGNVNRVIKNILQKTHIKDFVTENAITNGSTNPQQTKSTQRVLTVEVHSKETNTLNQSHAVKNVQHSSHRLIELKTIGKERKERVYDLQVEGVHEYYANGILVHNCDPSVLTRCAETETEIYIEYLSYSPMDTPEIIDSYMEAIGIERDIPITADSSDRYTKEGGGTVRMVMDLKRKGWTINKVSKTKSIVYWLSSMKKKKIIIVRNEFFKHAKKEIENYMWKTIDGIAINQPIDKDNHGIDSARYRHMSYNSQTNVSASWRDN